MDVDSALDTVGGYKRWHLAAFAFLSISGLLPICTQSLGIIFVGWVPPYHCSVQEDQMLNESLPMHENGIEYENCEMYVNISIDNSTTTCKYGYDYYSEGYSTIATDFDLVCEADFYTELAQTIYLMGTSLANILGSYLIDRFGRKNIHIICHLGIAIVGSCVAFSPNYLTFVIIRSICGMITVICVNSGVTLLLELFGTKKRAFAGIGFEFVWVFISMIPCFLGYFLKNWRINQLVASLISVIWIIYIWFLFESVPWLVANKRYTEAEETLMKMAKRNGIKNLQPIILNRKTITETEQNIPFNSKDDEVSPEDDEDSPKESKGVPLLDLVCDSKLRLHLIVVNIFWFANAMIYYALILTTPNLGVNRFAGYIIMIVIEIPAYITSIVFIDRIGRKKLQIMFFTIAGLSLGAAAFIPQETGSGFDLRFVKFTMVIAGKFGISGSFAVMVLYARELFPTTLRSSSVAWGGVGGELGAMVAPPASYLARHVFWLPSIIFATISLIAALATIPLPETMNKPLPLTTDDVHTIFYKKKSPKAMLDNNTDHDEAVHLQEKNHVET